MSKKVLISVTTFVGDWQHQIAGIKIAGIKEFAVFLTGLTYDQRPKLYKQLDQLENVRIPFIHAHSDMAAGELDYLIDRFGVQYFNIHTEKQFPLKNDLSWFNGNILIENSGSYDLENEELERYGGICLDISHLENDRLQNRDKYDRIMETINRCPVKANHISGVATVPRSVPGNNLTYDRHDLENMDQLNYLARYKEDKFLGELLAIELVDDIGTQLKAKKYIENILSL